MKILIFILSITMAMPSWARLTPNPTAETNPGVGLASGQCPHNQTNVEPAESSEMHRIRKELEAAKKELSEVEKDLNRVDCSECEIIVREALEIRNIEEVNIDAHIDHLDPRSSSCGFNSALMSNVDIYNYWAESNNWEKLEDPRVNYSRDRMIAGGPGDPELGGGLGEGECETSSGQVIQGQRGDDGRTCLPLIDPDAPTGDCKYARRPNFIATRLCIEAFGEGSSKQKKCRSCLRPRSTLPSSKLGACIVKSRDLNDKKERLEDKVDELTENLEDATTYFKENGESVASSGTGKGRGIFNAIAPMLIGGGLGYLVGNAYYKRQKKAILADDEIRKQQGYPIAGGSSVDSTGAIVLGAAVGYGAYSVATSSGAFGCSNNNAMAGIGSIFGGSQDGNGGIGAILQGILGKGDTGANGNVNGNLTGGLQTGGMVQLPNGQWVQGGANNGMMTAAQIQAQVDASNRAAADALARANAYQSYASAQASLAAENQASMARRQAILSGVDMSLINGQSSGVMMPGMSGVLQGGVNVSVGANVSPLMGSFQSAGAIQTGTNFNPNVGAPGSHSPTTTITGPGRL